MLKTKTDTNNSKPLFTALIFLLASLSLFSVSAQAQISSSTAYRVVSGTSTPATCNPGPGVTDIYIVTSGSPGVYWCSATDTWTVLGGGGGGGTPGGADGNIQINNAGAFGGVAGISSDKISKLTLGVAGTSVGSVQLFNATSGSISLVPVAGALGTVTITFPATTGTVALTSQLPAGANPTASLGLSAVNGVATTFMRSDAAPALDQTIAPTWTGIHTFTNGVTTGTGSTSGTVFNYNSLTTGVGMNIASTSTAGSGTGSTVLNVSRSGAQTGTVTTAAATISNTATGANATNVALALTASGATTANTAIKTTAGDSDLSGGDLNVGTGQFTSRLIGNIQSSVGSFSGIGVINGSAGSRSLRSGMLVNGDDIRFIINSGFKTGFLAVSGTSGWVTNSAGFIGFQSATDLSLGSLDLQIRRANTANLAHGAADAATAVSQIDSVQNIVAGTSNTAGADRYFDGSQGTGTGAGGSIIFRTAPAGSSGTAQNALSTNLQLSAVGNNNTTPWWGMGGIGDGFGRNSNNILSVIANSGVRAEWNASAYVLHGVALAFTTSFGATTSGGFVTPGAGVIRLANTNGGSATGTGAASLLIAPSSVTAAAQLHVATSNATTNAVTNQAILEALSSGTPAAGFGPGLEWRGQSSTTAGRTMGQHNLTWVDATDASRGSQHSFTVVGNAVSHEILRLTGGATGTPATGLQITSAAAGSGVTLTALSSGAGENMLLLAKSGSNTILWGNTVNSTRGSLVADANQAYVSTGSTTSLSFSTNNDFGIFTIFDSSKNLIGRAGSAIGWTSSTSNSNNAPDTLIRRAAAASIAFGNVASATPVANLLTIGESSRGGTDSNVGGANGTVRSGLGTGTGTLASLILRSPVAAASGTTAQTYATGLTILNGTAVLTSYIVANLPSASTSGAGAMAFVTDATLTAITGLGTTVAGGGSNKVIVYSDGTNWIIL